MTLTQIKKAGLDSIALDHVFTIGASGTDHYTFQGEGLNGTVNDPTLYLTRGKTYRFENGTGAHAIRIQSADNGTSGTLYNTGVTNNNTTGTVIVEVQHDSPDVLYYQCASHASMKGIIYITGALADGSVTTAKLADSTGSTDGVTSSKIASDAVTTTKIQDTAVTLAKLEHGTSSNDGKFLRANNGADPTFETISTTPADGSITEAKLANNAVTNSKIADTAITQAKLNYPVANRNLIINGACQIAQRSNLATAQTGYGAVDRYQLHSGGASRFTLSQNAGPGEQYGLPKALKFETITADNSVAAGDYMYLCQKLEGFDVQSIQKGSSDAKQVTLQFWIKLAVTGTYVVQLFDTDNSRHVVANYTVSSTNWEKKTITFPADTTGAFANDNGGSLEIRWHFLGGSTYRGGTQQTTWGSIVAANMLEGMGNAVSSTGDNFITGMQLEVGNVSTNFEHKSYGEELDICKRYYQQFGIDANGSAMRLSMPYINEHPTNTGGYINFRWEREMRATPTATIGSSLELGEPQVGLSSYKVSSFNSLNAQGTDYFQFSGGQKGNTGDSNRYIRFGHDSNAWAKFSAEL